MYLENVNRKAKNIRKNGKSIRIVLIIKKWN